MGIDWSTVDWPTVLTYSGVVATIIGVIVAVLFGFLTYRMAQQQKKIAEKQTELAEEQNILAEQMRPRMHLLAYVEAYIPLIRTEKKVVDEIEIQYRGEVVKNLASLQVRIVNIGNRPIRPEDYYSPLEFSVAGLIIEARQIKESYPDIVLLPNRTQAANKIECARVLLNQNDSVTLLLTISEQEGISARDSFSVRGRIVDGNIDYFNDVPSQSYKAKYQPTKKTHKASASPSIFGIIDILKAINLSIDKEDWPIIRDMMLILTLLLIAFAMLLDAIIPF